MYRSLCVTGMMVMLLSAAANGSEAGYITDIKPVFEKQCAGCHGGDAPEYGDFEKDKEKFKALFKGPKMNTYPHLIYFIGWPDTGAVMRRLDDGTGTRDAKPGNMYQYLGADEAERQKNLKLFKAWVGNWTLKRFPELTKEELAGIKVKY